MFEKLFFNLLTLEKMTIVRLIKEQVFDFMKKRGIKNLFFLICFPHKNLSKFTSFVMN